MVEKMRRFLKELFFTHWQRKTLAIIFAIAFWLLTNHSLTGSKTLDNVNVKVINIAENEVAYCKPISLTLVGKRSAIEDISSNDLEIIVDASQKEGEWIPCINKKNLKFLTPDSNISRYIDSVSYQNFVVRTVKLATEKIPVIITQPAGDPPKGYKFLDVWPYKLNLTVHGPEDTVKYLKSKELKLTFNLNNISKSELDVIPSSQNGAQIDEVSFFVPEEWKEIQIPLLSSSPITITDPIAKALRIDFVRCNLLPLNEVVPVSVFYPIQYSAKLNPQTCYIEHSDFVQKINGIFYSAEPLYVKDVSPSFLKVIQHHIQILVTASPKDEKMFLDWTVQLTNPDELEDQFVSMVMSDITNDEFQEYRPQLKEQYLRNRFRSYLHRFSLAKANGKKLDLKVELNDNNKISITEWKTETN